MKRSTFNYIKQILKDYSQIDDHIKRRMEELQYPHRPDDVNAGIKGNGQSDSMANLMITIEQDRRLSALERTRKWLKIISMSVAKIQKRLSQSYTSSGILGTQWKA